MYHGFVVVPLLLSCGVVHSRPDLSNKAIQQLKSELREHGLDYNDDVWNVLGKTRTNNDYSSSYEELEDVDVGLSEILETEPIEAPEKITKMDEVVNIEEIKNLFPINPRTARQFLREEGLLDDGSTVERPHRTRPSDYEVMEDESEAYPGAGSYRDPVGKAMSRKDQNSLQRLLGLLDIDSLDDIKEVVPITKITEVPEDHPALDQLLDPLLNNIATEDNFEAALDEKYAAELAKLKAIAAVKEAHEKKRGDSINKLRQIKKQLDYEDSAGDVGGTADKIKDITGLSDIKTVLDEEPVDIMPISNMKEIAKIYPLSDEQALRLKEMARKYRP